MRPCTLFEPYAGIYGRNADTPVRGAAMAGRCYDDGVTSMSRCPDLSEPPFRLQDGMPTVAGHSTSYGGTNLVAKAQSNRKFA